MAKLKILIPRAPYAGVEVQREENEVVLSNSSGKSSRVLVPKGVNIDANKEEVRVFVEEKYYEEQKNYRKKFLRSIVGTLAKVTTTKLEGLAKGVEVKMKMVGTGYKAKIEGDSISLTIGYSHPKLVVIPKGIEARADNTPSFSLKSHDKENINNFVNKLIKIKGRIDVYKGTGIFVEGTVLKLKEINKK